MLLVSIHDVAPPHLDVVARMRDDLARWGAARVTLLAIPDYHGRAPLERSPHTGRWLRRSAEAGDEIALHGYHHRQRGSIPSRLDRLRARALTAGEGECLALAEVDRRRMLHQGRRIVEDAIGRAVEGFVAPAWLEPRGFGRHLAAAGFHWHEGSTWIERLDPGARTLAPVIGFATRTRAREIASRAWAAGIAASLAPLATRGLAPIRIALHPADATSPAVMRAIERLVRWAAARYRCATVTELTAHATETSPGRCPGSTADPCSRNSRLL
jgi:uncharacterized protein